MTTAPVDIRALAEDVVRTARCALALQSGTAIAWEDDATLPACIQARR